MQRRPADRAAAISTRATQPPPGDMVHGQPRSVRPSQRLDQPRARQHRAGRPAGLQHRRRGRAGTAQRPGLDGRAAQLLSAGCLRPLAAGLRCGTDAAARRHGCCSSAPASACARPRWRTATCPAARPRWKASCTASRRRRRSCASAWRCCCSRGGCAPTRAGVHASHRRSRWRWPASELAAAPACRLKDALRRFGLQPRHHRVGDAGAALAHERERLAHGRGQGALQRRAQ